MFDSFKDQATFYAVYIAEAHAVDEWQAGANEAEGIEVEQHTTFAARLDAAKMCADKLGLTVPTLVDGMDDAALETFSAWPERIYIADASRAIHYRGGHGPYDFSPSEARDSLVNLLQG